MRNEKWEIRIELWINRKRFVYWFVKLTYKIWIITGLIDKKSCKKQKKKYSKEKATEYYKQKSEAIKEKSRELYKNLSQGKKRQD